MNIGIITIVFLLIYFVLFFIYRGVLQVVEKQYEYTKCWNEYIAKQANAILSKNHRK